MVSWIRCSIAFPAPTTGASRGSSAPAAYPTILINFYADAGLLYKGLNVRRPDDKVGVAAGYARVGDNARGLDSDIGSFGNFFYPVRSGEVMVEMIYQAQIAPWWMLQPEIQYIFRPGAGVLNSDGSFRQNAWVIALRSALNF